MNRMNKKAKRIPRSLISLLLALALTISIVPVAFAAQECVYHDPAEHWLTANDRTNELDVNAVVTHETFYCCICEKNTSFTQWRTAEYTRDGASALTRNVKYSDGTMADGTGKGTILDGTPGVDTYYTGYHWTKAMCDTCGTLNSNEGMTDYGFNTNVYSLYDCAADFMEDLDGTVRYEYADSTYHTKITTGGEYCCFCYGTRHTDSSVLERHTLQTEIIPQTSNGRFAVVEHCTLCDYTKTSYVAAKSVVADYYGVADGQPHTITVSDLSESGVRTQIRYGNSAQSCTLTSAPSYTEEGQYTVYYEIVYTYNGVEMTENGVANVWLRDTAPAEDGSCSCGCGNPNCGCQDSDCKGGCCGDKGCSGDHNFRLLDTVPPTCLTLGYSRYLCLDCGTIEKRDYENALGHAYQSVLIREATCETEGKLLEICTRCGNVKTTSLPKGEHRYTTYTVRATCVNPGYTVRECEICGERQITGLMNALSHNYVAYTTAPTCEAGGQTVYHCHGCGSSFVGDHTNALGHSWGDGEVIAQPTCTGEGVRQYTCARCGKLRMETIPATGHTLGEGATCLNPGTCTVCGAVLDQASGHNFQAAVTAPTCLNLGYTTYTCANCGESYKSDYTDPLGHDYKPIVTEPTCTEGGFTTYTCARCGDSYVDDYTDALGHDWDAGRVVTDSVCDSEGVMEYRCKRCGHNRMEAVSAKGHTPGKEATCTTAQLCTVCGAVLAEPTGHNFRAEVTAPSCLKMGYTTYTCDTCGFSYQNGYTDPLGHDYKPAVTEPTCTEGGSTTYTCANCGDSYVDDHTDALGHSWGDGDVIAQPTCTGEGVRQYTCAHCGKARMETIPATGHTPGEGATCLNPGTCTVCGAVLDKASGHNFRAEVTAPTCLNLGYTTYTCANCGESYKSGYTDPLGHDYKPAVTEPTCTEGGFTTYTCAHCGDSYVDDRTDALGHSWGDGDVIAQPTCTGEGVRQYTCTRCRETRMETIPATGHTPGEGATCLNPGTCTVCGAVLDKASGHNFQAEVTAPTCLKLGYTTYTCAYCGYSYKSDYTDPLGHDHKPVVTEPTCTEGGYSTYICTRCGDSYVDDYTDALGHDWDAGRVVTDSVCDSEGVVEYHCARCGYHRLEAVSEKGHIPGEEATCTTAQLCTVCGAVLAEPAGHTYTQNVTAPTCTELGYTTYTCENCGDSYKADFVNAAGHTAGDWIVDKEPTTGTEGSKHRVCVNCGEVLETGTIGKIYHFAYTGNFGEAVVGDYLVTVTDTKSGNAVHSAAVSLHEDGSLSVVLPDGRLIDYAAQTTVTVQRKADKSPVEGVAIAVTDQNGNYAPGKTGADGKLTVPAASDNTNSDGRITTGGTDKDGKPVALTVKVEDFESGRPIADANVEMKHGKLHILLPNGTDMDAGNRILVTVLYNTKVPVRALNVTVQNDLGNQEQGQTNRDGKLIVPALGSTYTDSTGTAIVGKYTVIVSDSGKKPVVKALVTLIEGKKDAFTVLLPDGRLLDANDKTTVTVLLPSGDPAVGLNVKVLDRRDNHAAKDTDKAGQVVVPDATGSTGETIGKDTGREDEANTIKVSVTDEGGREVPGAEITVDGKGAVTVTLPKDFTFEDDGAVTVTVTDNRDKPIADVSVSVTDGAGENAKGETDRYGKLTVPAKVEVAEHSAYIYGYPDGTFGPSRSMTRAEAAAIFARLLAAKNGDTLYDNVHCSFSDVPKRAWYAGYVKYLETFEILSGYADGTFHPDSPITRAEFVTISVRFYRAYGIRITEEAEKLAFSDVSRRHWAAGYIDEAAVNGWVVGYGDGTFVPDKPITRAEVVTIVNRVLNREADRAYIAANTGSVRSFPDVPGRHWAYYDVLEAANAHRSPIQEGAERWQGKR